MRYDLGSENSSRGEEKKWEKMVKKQIGQNRVMGGGKRKNLSPINLTWVFSQTAASPCLFSRNYSPWTFRLNIW